MPVLSLKSVYIFIVKERMVVCICLAKGNIVKINSAYLLVEVIYENHCIKGNRFLHILDILEVLYPNYWNAYVIRTVIVIEKDSHTNNLVSLVTYKDLKMVVKVLKRNGEAVN